MPATPQRDAPFLAARAPALIALVLVLIAPALLGALACARPAPPVPAPPGLAVIAPGQGQPFTPRPLLRVEARALVLPSGERCPVEGDCPALRALRGQPLAVDVGAELVVAELTQPLLQLAELAAPGAPICLRVAANGLSRCLDVRPLPAALLGAWMDAATPLAKVRLMVRADGMEVVTVRGKIPGPDRYGPSVPTRRGAHDFPALAAALARLAAHLPQEDEAALLASPRTPFQTAAQALAALGSASERQFARVLFVL